MDPAVRYGINARFDGACGLCGAPVVAGDRIFQLPKKRTGTAGRWVCAPCRWPDPDRVIDIPFVIRKAEQRLRGGPSYTPSMVEVDVIMDAVGAVVVMTEDEEVLLELLSEGKRTAVLPRWDGPRSPFFWASFVAAHHPEMPSPRRVRPSC